jgi:hypothetical protein
LHLPDCLAACEYLTHVAIVIFHDRISRRSHTYKSHPFKLGEFLPDVERVTIPDVPFAANTSPAPVTDRIVPVHEDPKGREKNIADRRDIFRAKPIVRRLIIGKGIHGRGKRQRKEIEAAEDQVGAHLSPGGQNNRSPKGIHLDQLTVGAILVTTRIFLGARNFCGQMVARRFTIAIL